MNPQYLDPLLHFLRIKSISTQDECLSDMQDARHFLKDTLSALGFSVEFLKGQKHDAVFAQKNISPTLPTVLIYGHYDVQPADPLEEWNTPPFEPTVKNGLVFARGANDNKGQIMTHIMAAKTLIDKLGTLPINLKFIIEGEEEIGSTSVESFAKKYGKNLFKCDYLMVSDSEMAEKGQPAIDISLRGLLYTEIEIECSKQDLHSGQFGGVAENPAILLAHLIAQLKDKKNKILIPHFYDAVEKPTVAELKDYKSFKTTPEKIIKEGFLYGIGGGESDYSVNERRWSRPTLDINGLVSGYLGEGSKTIIPAKASAKISMRLVPNQNPEKIYIEFVKYVKSLVPKTAKLKIIKHDDALPFKSPTNHSVFNLAKKSLRDNFGKSAVFQGVGGSIGFVPVMAKTLGVPCIMIGFGLPDDNLHSPNEHYLLENYFKGIDTMVDFYQNLANSTHS